MTSFPAGLIAGAWAGYALALAALTLAAKRAIPGRGPGLPSRAHFAWAVLCVAALVAPPLRHESLDRNRPLCWAGAAVTVAGLAASAVSHMLLCRVAAADSLLTGGPFAAVRHPTYAGLLLGGVGAAMNAQSAAAAAALAALVSLAAAEIREEEWVLRRDFAGAYAAYTAGVAAVVPFLV